MMLSFEEDLYQEVLKKNLCDQEQISFDDLINQDQDMNNPQSIEPNNLLIQVPKKNPKRLSQLVIKPRPPSS